MRIAGSLLLVFALLTGCERVPHRVLLPASASEPADSLYHPDCDLAELFHDVQLAQVFPDSKTFVDCEPLRDPAHILADYRRDRRQLYFRLDSFVLHNFRLPPAPPVSKLDRVNRNLEEHLHSMWNVLVRPGDDTLNPPRWSTRIPLPHPYVVPGGRFREIYYWDSYFTALGLVETQRAMDEGRIPRVGLISKITPRRVIQGLCDNFAYLIGRFGHIPNGSRTYYLSRSQPPVFALLVQLYEQTLADSIGAVSARAFVQQHYLPAMEREYQFWMDGADSLRRLPKSDKPIVYRRVVCLPGGRIANRYWDDQDTPRPESYREDWLLVQGLPPDSQRVIWRNLRAAAESGWDFSSRWMTDPNDLRTTRTTEVVPSDLYALLRANLRYRLEAFGNMMLKIEDPPLKDRHFNNRNATAPPSGAGFPALTITMFSNAELRATSQLLSAGGLLTTTTTSGQQWDAPNGWAPLQYLAYQAYRSIGDTATADTIRRRWLRTVQRVYDETGRIMEKYDVVNPHRPAGGGEYPTQDGFGWTNGVTLYFLGEERRASTR